MRHGSIEDSLFSLTFFFFYIPGTAVWGTFNFLDVYGYFKKSNFIWTDIINIALF